MDNSEFTEKRAFTRFAVNIPLYYFDLVSSKTGQAYTHDISALGLGVVSNTELPVGRSLDLCLRMSDNAEEIRRKGTVVWSNMDGPDKCRAGIKLEDPKLKPIPLVLRILSQQL